MALTKIGKEGITGISNSADATFLTATSSEGVTLAGTLAVTGVHTVGNNAIYTSEGGAVTQNLVQGLAKAHTVTVQTGTQSSGSLSFNISGITDNGTGRTDIAFTNNFSAAAYSVVGLNKDGSGYNDVATIANSAGTYTTSAFEIFCCQSASDGSGNANDASAAMTAYFGDLA